MELDQFEVRKELKSIRVMLLFLGRAANISSAQSDRKEDDHRRYNTMEFNPRYDHTLPGNL